MCALGQPITLLLICLFGSATSSPVSTYTPAPPLPSQISPPSPSSTILPSLASPYLSVSTPVLPPPEFTGDVSCHLTILPSSLVVRFGHRFEANCSVQGVGMFVLGWDVPLASPEFTNNHFLIWSVDNMTEWSIEQPFCYAVSEKGGQCQMNLTVTVYKPPDAVSLSFVDHTGPMREGVQYTLQCEVKNVAPVANLIVTFFRGQTELSRLRSSNTEKEPVNETFTVNITPSKDDDGAQYRCEAKLQLGPEGPEPAPVVTSEVINATVHFGPQFVCPKNLLVREGERLSCEVQGNPRPSVTWFRNGQVVVLPAHSRRNHTGRYTICATGLIQKDFTVEVEVLPVSGSGMGPSFNGHFLLVVLLAQMINFL